MLSPVSVCIWPLFTGRLAGFTVTFPCHDWGLDIRTGRFLDAPALGLTVSLVPQSKVFYRAEYPFWGTRLFRPG